MCYSHGVVIFLAVHLIDSEHLSANERFIHDIMLVKLHCSSCQVVCFSFLINCVLFTQVYQEADIFDTEYKSHMGKTVTGQNLLRMFTDKNFQRAF